MRGVQGIRGSCIMNQAEFEPQTTTWSIARRLSLRRAAFLRSFVQLRPRDDVSLFADEIWLVRIFQCSRSLTSSRADFHLPSRTELFTNAYTRPPVSVCSNEDHSTGSLSFRYSHEISSLVETRPEMVRKNQGI